MSGSPYNLSQPKIKIANQSLKKFGLAILANSRKKIYEFGDVMYDSLIQNIKTTRKIKKSLFIIESSPLKIYEIQIYHFKVKNMTKII